MERVEDEVVVGVGVDIPLLVVFVEERGRCRRVNSDVD